MSSISSIIARGKGTAGAWRVERDHLTVDAAPERNGPVRVVERATLRHYGTVMVRWRLEDPADPAVLEIGTGWGSVSDQNGVNTACSVLGLPFRMNRDQRGGGPRITDLREVVSMPREDWPTSWRRFPAEAER